MDVSFKILTDMLRIFHFEVVDAIADGALAYGTIAEQSAPFLSGEFPSANNLSTIFISNTSSMFSPTYARFYLFKTQTITTLAGVFEFLEGNDTLQYSTAGQFGLAISFYNLTTTKGGSRYTGFTVHTPPFITIISGNTLDTQHNNAVTVTLTLFILMFAAIDVRADTNPQYCRYRETDNKPETKKGKKRKRGTAVPKKGA
jgi:hypothetical protein